MLQLQPLGHVIPHSLSCLIDNKFFSELFGNIGLIPIDYYFNQNLKNFLLW